MQRLFPGGVSVKLRSCPSCRLKHIQPNLELLEAVVRASCPRCGHSLDLFWMGNWNPPLLKKDLDTSTAREIRASAT